MINDSFKPESIDYLKRVKTRLRLRSKLIHEIHRFFNERDFIEVATPLLVSAPAPEEYIEAPQAGDKFLRTSPELEMKEMLAAGYEKIYQLGPCFRQGENGNRHREEFTMLEWYHTDSNYMELLSFTRDMLIQITAKLFGDSKCVYHGNIINYASEWEIITVKNAFAKFAGISPEAALANNSFEELMVTKIEPNLGISRPTVLIDYPANCAAFARIKKDDSSVAERWELYLGGLEIANAYGELIDPIEQKQRFAEFAETRRSNGLRSYPDPKNFLAALEYGIPESSGCALGVERLLMALSDAKNIDDVAFHAE